MRRAASYCYSYLTQIRQSQETVDVRFQDYAMNSTELHRWIADYNWDDGLDPIWVIADSQKTECDGAHDLLAARRPLAGSHSG